MFLIHLYLSPWYVRSYLMSKKCWKWFILSPAISDCLSEEGEAAFGWGGLGEDRWSQLCCVLAGRLGSCESLHHVIRRLTPCLAGDGGVPWDLGGSCSWISVWLLDFPTRWSLRSKGEFVNKLSRTIPYAASTVLGIIS